MTRSISYRGALLALYASGKTPKASIARWLARGDLSLP
jgi:hypothetical protein